MDQTHKIKPLPRPTSTSEIYLAFILDALEDIKAELTKSEPEYAVTVGGEIELKEPEKLEITVTLTSLPDAFPGKDALEEAGVIYLEEVPRLGADLIEINGIGAATANKILTWFKT